MPDLSLFIPLCELLGSTLNELFTGKCIPEEDTANFRREHLGFIFQEYNLLETLTIYENIALALTVKEIPKESICQTIHDLSEKLIISDILYQFPYEVSGGQQ